MNTFLGMESEEVEDLARRYVAAAGELDRLHQRLANVGAEVTWIGEDWDGFDQVLTGTVLGLVKTGAQQLATQGGQLSVHLAEQELASAAMGPALEDSASGLDLIAAMGTFSPLRPIVPGPRNSPGLPGGVGMNTQNYLTGGVTSDGLEPRQVSGEERRLELLRDGTGDYSLTETDVEYILESYQVSEEELVEWSVKEPWRTLAELAGLQIETVEIPASEAEVLDGLGPSGMLEFNANKDLAESASMERFPSGNTVDNHQDAFRHAYINALTANDLGDSWATDYWTAHERIPGNLPAIEAMDLYNNQVGRRIAGENPGATDAELADLVEEAIHNGEMVVINSDGELVPSNSIGMDETGHPAPGESAEGRDPAERTYG